MLSNSAAFFSIECLMEFIIWPQHDIATTAAHPILRIACGFLLPRQAEDGVASEPSELSTNL
jgi:hypothetical protein